MHAPIFLGRKRRIGLVRLGRTRLIGFVRLGRTRLIGLVRLGRTRRVGLVRLETDKTHSHFRLRKFRSSYQGTKNVAIYTCSLGKILDVRQIAGVKDMTNIMSDTLNI